MGRIIDLTLAILLGFQPKNSLKPEAGAKQGQKWIQHSKNLGIVARPAPPLVQDTACLGVKGRKSRRVLRTPLEVPHSRTLIN